MTQPGSTESWFDWFHELAALPEGDLSALAGAVEGAKFIEFIKWQLPGSEVPNRFEAQAFAEAVTLLRTNERKWNHALQLALIEADDLSKEKGPAAARNHLTQFAEECPWVLFKEAASSQSLNY